MSTDRQPLTRSQELKAKIFTTILALIAACPTATVFIIGGYQLLSK